MTPEERQALRETHVKRAGIDGDGGLTWFCRKCNFVSFPCDVIKVLDKLDQVANAAEIYGITVRALVERDNERTDGLVSPAQTDTEPVSKRVPNQCDNEHPQMRASASKSKKRSNLCNDDTHEPDESVFYTDIGWNYCPRCGEKL